MKRYLALLFLLLVVSGMAQVQRVNFTVTNNITSNGDTIFVTTINGVTDTIYFTADDWTKLVDNISNNNAGDVTLNGQVFVPDIAASGTKYSGNVAGIGTDNRLFPKSIIDLYQDMRDTTRASSAAISGNLITVYSKDTTRLYDDFSTAAAAARAGDIVELSPTTFTETGTVTLPANTTLRFYNGALLSGTFSLVGNNTIVEAERNQIFGTSITITGTWVADVYPEWFGTTGDGVTDDAVSINLACAFSRLTKTKTIEFQKLNYFIGSESIEINDLIVNGNGAQIIAHPDGTNQYAFWARAGAKNSDSFIGSSDTALLAFNGYKGDRFVTTTNTGLYNNLAYGDLVFLTSRHDYSPQNDIWHGEIKRVESTGDSTIIFSDYIFDSSYLVSDTAVIYKVNSIRGVIKNITIEYDSICENTYGIFISNGDGYKIENVKIINAYQTGIYLENCYSSRVNNCDIINSSKTGTGYGIMTAGACTYTFIANTQVIGAKHLYTCGSAGDMGVSSSSWGVSWETHISSLTGTVTQTGAYGIGTHNNNGSLYLSNCSVFGGKYNSLTPFNDWNVDTTYSTNDTVRFNGLLYVAKTSTTGTTPGTEFSEWRWTVGNSLSAYQIGGGSIYMSDCQADGFNYLFQANTENNDNDINIISINGLTGKNCEGGIEIAGSNPDSLIINTLILRNINVIAPSVPVLLKAAVKIGGYCRINYISIQDIYGYNCQLLYLNGAGDNENYTFSGLTQIMNPNYDVSENQYSIQVVDTNYRYLNFSDVNISGGNNAFGGYFQNINVTSSDIDVYQNFIKVDDFNKATNSITIKNSRINMRLDTESGGRLINAINENINNLDIDANITTLSDKTRIVNTGKTISTLKASNSYFEKPLEIAGTVILEILAEVYSNGNINGDVTVNDNFIISDTSRIMQGSDYLLHTYSPDGSGQNLFCGNAGNITLTAAADYNTGIGNNALIGLTKGAQNTAVGNLALAQDTTGSDNVAVGLQSLYTNKSGSSNTSVGSSALNKNVSGSYSTAVGTIALYNNTGSANSSFGQRALFTNTSGTNNSAFGRNSLQMNNTGSYNNAFGNYALNSNSTGSYNNSFGYRAGYNETGSYKSYWASDSTSWANGMASGSKLLFYGDMSNASKSNHFLNIFAKVAIGEAKALSAYSLEVAGAVNVTTSLTIGTFLQLTPTADPPGSPVKGMVYFDTDGKMYGYDGSTWNACW